MKILNRRRWRAHKRRGLSEILGALMLILVVVIAVGTIAYFVSAAQKQEMDRQSHLDSVKNEKVEFVSSEFYPSDQNVDFELANATSKFHVGRMDANETGVRIFDHGVERDCKLTGGSYSGNATIGSKASLAYPGGNCELTIDPAGNISFKPATWEIMNFTIRNLNTQDSGILGLRINDRFVTWEGEVDPSSNSFQTFARGSPLPLVLPAQETRRIMVNFSDPDNANMSPKKTDPLKFALFTSTANFYESIISPPSQIVSVNVQREDYSVATRDVIVLDASKSTFSDGRFAKAFVWKLDIPSPGWKVDDWNDLKHLTSKYLTGKVVEYRPEAILNSTELSKLNVTGPLRVTLKAVDDEGVVSQSGTTIIPKDPNLAPIGGVSLSFVGSPIGTGDVTTPITIQVKDIFGRNVTNTGVTFSLLGGDHVKLIQIPFAITNSTGMADTTVEWIGRVAGDQALVSATTGRLPPLVIRLSEP